MPDFPVWPEAELRDCAAELSPAMRHVLLRCSEYTDWSARHERGIERGWIDVVAGFHRATFRGTIGGLQRRGLVVLVDGNSVAATLLGLAVRGRLIREGFRP
jgi:hypothetical protein